MIDKFDYAEPACPFCDGKDFYYPKKDTPLGRIPVGRVIEIAEFQAQGLTEAACGDLEKHAILTRQKCIK